MWVRVDGTYIGITVPATRLMQVVPLDWIHYLQMLLPKKAIVLFIVENKTKAGAVDNYHVGMRRKCKTITEG